MAGEGPPPADGVSEEAADGTADCAADGHYNVHVGTPEGDFQEWNEVCGFVSEGEGEEEELWGEVG